MSSLPQTDVVFVNSLELSANIGPDRWGKSRPQPVLVSIYLHLHSLYLVSVGETDDVRDSVHYGHLSNAITDIVAAKNTFSGIDGLVDVVTKAAFELAGEAAAAVKVIVDLRQMILLANGFSVEVTTPAGTSNKDASVRVIVKDMLLPTIIGVNPPERESKQQVIINIVFFEKASNHSPIDYQKIVTQISKAVDSSSYLTLEKFVTEILRIACLASEALDAVTVRAQKPSALTFAHSSGVEITRKRSAFTSTV